MRHYLGLVVLASLFLLGSVSSVRAEKHEASAEKGHSPEEYLKQIRKELAEAEEHPEKAIPKLREEVNKLEAALKAAESHKGDDGGLFGKPKALIDLGVWTLVVFGLLAVVLWKSAWGPMLQGLKKRETSIAEAKQFAEDAKVEAESLKLKLKEESDQASQRAAEMIEEARNDASRTAEELKAKAQEDIQAQKERAMRDLGTARDQALQDIFGKATELATVMSEKAIRRHVSADDHRQFLDEAINEINANGAA